MCDLGGLESAVEQCAVALQENIENCESLGEALGGEEFVEVSAEELEEEAILLHYGFSLMTLMLTIGFIGGYMLEKKHFTYIHEAGGHLLPTGR